MSESANEAPPITGIDEIDEVLARVDLNDDVNTHPAQLAAALEVLQQALNRPIDS